jgi:4-amino-4-deoxy-L-arabinose transferase-like glycosyltransferase
MTWLRRHGGLISLLALYTVLAFAYSVVNPLFEAPDEVWHYEYVRWLVEGNGLPAAEDIGVAPFAQEGSQPPLYYALGAALTAAIPTDNAAEIIRYNPHAAVGEGDSFGNRNRMLHTPAQGFPWQGVARAAHRVRLLSVALGLVTVACTYGLSLVILRGRKRAALLAAALVALNPQFLFISASVTNDTMVTALSAATLLLAAMLLAQSRAPDGLQLVALGSLVGAAALSKLSGLLAAFPAAYAISIGAWQRRSWREFVRGALVAFGVAALVAGWWFWRNQQQYGDALGLAAMFAVLPGRDEAATLRVVLSEASGVWRSMWGVFGWFNLPADAWLAWFYAGVVAIGCAFAAWEWLRRRSADGAQIVLLLIWIGLASVSVVRWAQISHAQGRLLFPALPALAVLVGWGWDALARRFTVRWPTRALMAGMAAIAVAAPLLWILPAYSQPPALGDDFRPSLMLNAVADSAPITLLGADALAPTLVAGEALEVTLYWRAADALDRDLSVFIHAVDEYGNLIAQHDSFPATGSSPTSTWQQGKLYADTHRLTLPWWTPARSPLRIEAGLYDFATGERTQFAGADSVIVGQVQTIRSANPVPVVFGDRIGLVDAEVVTGQVRAGEAVEVRLEWEAQRKMDEDYVVFTHLVLPPGEVWAQFDDLPQGGEGHTSTWQLGMRVTDRIRLQIPEDVPAGNYTVEVGVYDRRTMERLQVDGSDAGVVVGRVAVTGEK